MTDVPGVVLTATIWAYWFGVGAMIVRVRRKTRKLGGLVPVQHVERLMWLIWVPLVVAWIVLPYLALTHARPPLGLPEFARQEPLVAMLRWAAALCAVCCLVLTVKCWKRMGRNWSMAIIPGQKTQLITDGMFARVRHPIYALSILLMVCSAVIVPTVPMIAVAAVHVTLMALKAGNEERYLLATHGEAYEAYRKRTGRFFPRMTSRDG